MRDRLPARTVNGCTMRNGWRALLVALALNTAPAQAGPHTIAECFEGSDFIANAALARENGMPRAVFLARMEEDLVLIQAFPPALRWFARDPDDERFLLQSVRDVFDVPVAPEGHRARFLDACFARSTV